MTKSERIETGDPYVTPPLAHPDSWREVGDIRDDHGNFLAGQILNAMEQGIIVWSADGICELHNSRIYGVLELQGDAFGVGTLRDDFLEASFKRGEFSQEKLDGTKRQFASHLPFQFDRDMPSGRVVTCYARPTREGGYVVTFTDVSEVRKTAQRLAEAKQHAEDAETNAKKVLQDERARRAEARALSDFDEWLQSCKSLNEMFMIVQKYLENMIPGSRGELYLYSNSRDVLDGVCEWGRGVDINAHITADECWALRRGRWYSHNPHALCFPCGHLQDDVESEALNYICIPVVAHGDTVGLLHVQFSSTENYENIKTMGRFATRCTEHISMAIANVKLRDELHDQSIRDPLTGLYNRRYFMDAMRRETSVSDRGRKSFGLISLDADKFKTFNDNHGHEAGDMVLRALAEHMLATLPKDAICARVGGEEFTILLPDIDAEETMKRAETLREAVALLEVRTSFGALPRMTISAGVAVYLGDATSPNALMKKADEALYAAKADGRNCVKLANFT